MSNGWRGAACEGCGRISSSAGKRSWRGDVGIWHETYLIRAGEYESIYSGMPLMGLAKAAQLADISGDAEAARGRLGAVADEAQLAAGEKRLNAPA